MNDITNIVNTIASIAKRVRKLETLGFATAGSVGPAPSDSHYVVTQGDPILTNEHLLQAGTGIVVTTIAGFTTLSLALTAVVAGAYGSATQVGTFTVDAYGRLTAAANVAISGVPPLVHNVLDSTYHGDVLTGGILRGDILYGNATPKIARLAKGTAGAVLTCDATDTLWSTFYLSGTALQTYTFPAVGGTCALGAGTLTVSTANNVTIASHTHAITSVSSSTAAANLLACNASGYLQLIRLGIGVAPSYVLDVSGGLVRIVSNGDKLSMYEDDVAAADGYFKLSNNTGAAGVFGPIFSSKSNAAGNSGMLFMGDTTTDTGSVAIVTFLARQNNTIVATRPLFSFQNYSTVGGGFVCMQILANGYMGVGTTSADRKFHVEYDRASTGTVEYAMRITRIDSSGGTLAGTDGVGLEFELETTTSGTNRVAATIEGLWVAAGLGSQKGSLKLFAYDTAPQLGIEIQASGSAPMIGFLGATAIVRPLALTVQLTTITYTAPGAPDYALQDLVDSSAGACFGFATKDEGNTLLSVVENLQIRFSELEDKLGHTVGLGLLTH